MSLENTGEIVFIEVSKPSKKEKNIYIYRSTVRWEEERRKGGKKMNVIFYINFTGSIPCFIAHIPQR